MVQVKVIRKDPLVEAAVAWRALLEATEPLSFELTHQNASAVSCLIDKFLESGFSMEEPLVQFLMGWLAEYERQNVDIPEASPAEVLRHLMEANGLKQADLSAELGGQSVVSAILNGKREINVRQARALAARFRVSAATFIAAHDAKQEFILQQESTSARATAIQVIGASQVVPQYLSEVYVTHYQ